VAGNLFEKVTRRSISTFGVWIKSTIFGFQVSTLCDVVELIEFGTSCLERLATLMVSTVYSWTTLNMFLHAMMFFEFFFA
jgi:hypothetical protein